MHIESSNGITDFTITVNVNVSRMKQINKPDWVHHTDSRRDSQGSTKSQSDQFPCKPWSDWCFCRPESKEKPLPYLVPQILKPLDSIQILKIKKLLLSIRQQIFIYYNFCKLITTSYPTFPNLTQCAGIKMPNCVILHKCMLHITDLSVFLVFWKAAAEDDNGILNLEQFLLQNAKCRIVFRQY